MRVYKNVPLKLDSIAEMHSVLGFPKPVHPLISLVNYGDITMPHEELPKSIVLGFYKISYKVKLKGKIKYGQSHYAFADGGLSFISPNQVIASADDEQDYSGCTLLIHPDFIRGYPLDERIRTFGFFLYSANEALLLSDKEEKIILSIFEQIREELNGNTDDFSQDVIVAHIDVLLNYSNRFYRRQFTTTKVSNNKMISQMEDILNRYFASEEGNQKGLPTVECLAAQLNVSPRYLSDMLRAVTGQNAQQHIHKKVIEKAKEYLTATHLTVAEIAYQLGFEQPQSFNKLFKKKTLQTPVAFRQSFN